MNRNITKKLEDLLAAESVKREDVVTLIADFLETLMPKETFVFAIESSDGVSVLTSSSLSATLGLCEIISLSKKDDILTGKRTKQ